MSQSSRDDKAQVALAFAADYLEVLATARSARLLPARRCLVALVRKTAAARIENTVQGLTTHNRRQSGTAPGAGRRRL